MLRLARGSTAPDRFVHSSRPMRPLLPMVSRFVATRPRYTISQERSLEWLALAHAASEAALKHLDEDGRARFADRMRQLLERCACGPQHIHARGHSVPEIQTFRFDDDNVLYPLRAHPRGRDAAVRTRLFAEAVDEYFTATYASEPVPPDDLIHVTCTGYVSPSGAQQLIARRGWGTLTRVLHAYQMGCYAAIPVLRIASGLIATGSQRVDIAHTELCTLHLDPSDHRLEQLVIQSLFADGYIRYCLAPDQGDHGLRVLALHERVLPDSAHAMRWVTSEHGMHMTLSRDVPERIAEMLRTFVAELLGKAGHDIRQLRGSVFAVHPGGPKILDRTRSVLELSEPQLAASRAVLAARGNMSSATLPHIWQHVLDDPAVPTGTLVPSLAFGPGLTLCGALLEKC